MHPMISLMLMMSLLLTLIEADLEPHRTIVDLSRFDSSLERTNLDPNKPNITIGFLSSFEYIGKLIAGAVPLAVDMVNGDQELLPDHNLKFIAYDSGKAETATPLQKMTQLKEEGVVGFIGLDGSCEHEALLASAWNMTMISYDPQPPEYSLACGYSQLVVVASGISHNNNNKIHVDFDVEFESKQKAK